LKRVVNLIPVPIRYHQSASSLLCIVRTDALWVALGEECLREELLQAVHSIAETGFGATIHHHHHHHQLDFHITRTNDLSSDLYSYPLTPIALF